MTPSSANKIPFHPVDKVMAESRAAPFRTRSIKKDAKLDGYRLAVSMTDLTTLEGKDTPGKVRSLCQKGIAPATGTPLPDGAEQLPHVAAICVYPELIPTARASLGDSGVKIASVATAFPSGQYPLSVRLDDVAKAVDAGADEIDMVISRGSFLAGRLDEVATIAVELGLAIAREIVGAAIDKSEVDPTPTTTRPTTAAEAVARGAA